MPTDLNTSALDVYNTFNQANLSPTDYTAQGVYDSFNAQNTSTTPSLSQRKQLTLEERALRKAAKQGYQGDDLLGFTRADEFYDSDTIYNNEFQGGVRLGNRLSSSELYANAPEKTKFGAQSPEYLASRVALARFSQGLPAESKAFYDELRSDPAKLVQYQSELANVQGDLLTIRGEAGVVDEKHGRQVGQVYNPALGEESLQDRLLATGTASMYDMGEEKGRAGNMIDALQYGLGRAATGIAEAFVDTATWMVKAGYKGFTGESEKEATAWINDNASLFSRDETGDFTGLEDYGEAEMYGYDNSRTKEVTANLGKAFESGSTAEMAGAVLDGVLTAGPEFFLESAGEMAAALTGAGVVAIAGKYSNEILDERQANLEEGEELTMGDRAFAVTVGAAVSLLNKLGADEIIGNTKVVKGTMELIGKPGGDTVARQVLSTLAAKAAETAGKGVYEGLEEVAQEMLQKVGEKYGTAAQDELMSSETGKELFQAFGGGFAGGATPGAGMAAVDVAKPLVAASGIKEAAIGAKDAATGVAGKVKDLKEEFIPSKDTTEEQIRQRNEREAGESMSTPPEESIESADITPEDTAPEVTEAEVKVVQEEAPVGDVTDDTENSEDVDQGLDTFDKGFDAILQQLTIPIDQVNEAKEILSETGETIDADTEEKYTIGVKGAATNYISKLGDLRDQVAEAGAGPNAIAAMDAKIEKLIPLMTAKTTDELSGILNSEEVTTTQKVRAVLGSSAASVEQLSAIAETKDISPLEKRLVEAKMQAVKTYKSVTREKLIGGGSKPGIFQWLSYIEENGSISDTAVGNIKVFVDGQARKLKAFKAAQKQYNDIGDGKNVKVNFGQKNEYTGVATEEFIKTMEKEAESLNTLLAVANEVVGNKPAPVEQKPVKKAETKPTPVVTPKEIKTAPKAAEVKLPTAREVAVKIYKGQKLGKEDLQVQINEGAEIEKLLAKGKKADDKKAIAKIAAEKSKSPLLVSDSGTVMLDIPTIRTKKREGFDEKDENHITIIGFKTAKLIMAAPDETQAEIRDLIENMDITYTLDKEAYTIKKDYPEAKWKDKEGVEQTSPATTREAVVQTAQMPGLEPFYKELSKLLGKDIAAPFPHVTRRVKGHKAGIAINSKKDFDALEKTSLTAKPVVTEEPVMDETVTEPEFDGPPVDQMDIEETQEEIFMDVENVDTTPVTDTTAAKPKVSEKAQTKRDKGTIAADIKKSLEDAMVTAPRQVFNKIQEIIDSCKG